MKTKNDPRHQSRVLALQKLFEHEFKSNTPFALDELRDIDTYEDGIDESFLFDLINGVEHNKEPIDDLIRKYAVKRPFNDIAKIDVLVLRIAIFELVFASPKQPEKVVIDEAVELAKEFGGERSFTFINGVLGNITQTTHD